MQLDEVPMPAAVAARPRDSRGYPVLAITPWQDGQPRFGFTGTDRVLICAVERRCAICGLPMQPGQAWRVVSAVEAAAILDATGQGVPYANAAPTVEPPGHHACMVYSAIVCPYLARPNARRGQDVSVLDFTAGRGDQRGEVDGIGGAVAGFRAYEFRVDTFVTFRFTDLIACTPHRLGDDQMDALLGLLREERSIAEPAPDGRATTESARAEKAPAEPARNVQPTATAAACPPWLLDDEDLARERARRYR